MSDAEGLTPLPTAARLVRRHLNTVRNWQDRGLLDTVRVAGRRYVRTAQLHHLIENGDDTVTNGLTPEQDAWLRAQHMTEVFSGLTAHDIEALSMDEFARLRQRAGLAPVQVRQPVAEPTAGQPQHPGPVQAAPDDTPQGFGPDSPEFFRAWRSQRVSGGEGKGIFDSVGSQSQEYRNAAHHQAGRTGWATSNVIPAPALTGRQERQGDMIDRRTRAERFGTPGNSFEI